MSGWYDPPIEEPPTAAECLEQDICGGCYEVAAECECEQEETMTDKPKKPKRTLDQQIAELEQRQARERKLVEVREARDELCAAIGGKEWAIALDWAKTLVLQLEPLAAAKVSADQLDMAAAFEASP